MPRGFDTAVADPRERDRRIREIDADFEIVEWRSDPDGDGALVVDRNGVRSTLPLKDLRDAQPGLFEERLREVLLANVPGMVLPAPVEPVAPRPLRPARPIQPAAGAVLSSELPRLRPRIP